MGGIGARSWLRVRVLRWSEPVLYTRGPRRTASGVRAWPFGVRSFRLERHGDLDLRVSAKDRGRGTSSRRGAKARSGRFRASRARRKPTNGCCASTHRGDGGHDILARYCTAAMAEPSAKRRKCAQRALIARRRGVGGSRDRIRRQAKRLVLENRAVAAITLPAPLAARQTGGDRRAGRGVMRLKQALCCVVRYTPLGAAHNARC